MTRRLQVNVQMDRLPNVEGGAKDGWAQFGISLSAAIDPDANDTAQTGDRALLLPWLWRNATAPGNAWNPHDMLSWRIWRVPDNGDAERIDGWEIASKAPADFDAVVAAPGPIPPFGRLRARVDEEIDLILGAGGPGTLEAPAAGTAIVSRTVFGLVASLASLPHPVPSGFKIWAAIQTGAALDVDARYIAVPVFANADGDRYQTWDTAHPEDDASALKPTRVADGKWRFDYPTETTPIRGGWANLGSSYPLSLMQIGADDPQRLIDLSTLLVRNGTGPAVEGLDWSSDLIARIAETIDPALRAESVLETVLASVASTAQDEKDAPDPTRAALRADLARGGADHFRKALQALAAPPLAHRARGSRGAPAPALGFLQGVALLDPDLWPTAATLMLAHAGAETHGTPPAAPAFVAVRRSRLAQAAGLDPKTDLDEAVASEPPDLAATDALRAWLTRHWTTMPEAEPAPDHTGRRVWRQTLDRLVARPGAAVARRVDPLGVIDLGRLRGPRDQTFELVFAVRGMVDGETASVALAPPDNPRAAKLEATLSVDAAGITLASGGFSDGPRAFTNGELRLKVTATPDGVFAATVAFTSPDTPPLQVGPFDVTQVAAAGLLGMETLSPATADLALILKGEIPSAAVERLAAGRPWRTQASLAYYGAEASGLMAGWIEGTQANPDWSKEDLRTTLIAAIAAYVPSAFDAAFAAAIDRAFVAPELLALLDALRDAAKADAIERAKTLVPEARDDRNVRSEDALPLTFVFDQLQDFEEGVDLWSRLAGLGVLIRRTDAGSDAATDEWWSLNRATLHAPRPTAKGARPPLSAENAVAVKGAADWDDLWRKNSRVDPAPLVVGEMNGARSAVVNYENRPIVGELQGAVKLQPGSGRYVARRPEAYYFPTAGVGAMRLPPLTFGRSYEVVPYLIGQGGVMPPALRETADDPTSGPRAWSASYETLRVARAGLAGSIREAQYLRTVPIRPPGLVESGTIWPPAPEAVKTLRGELPPRMPPVTLPDNVPTRFFATGATGTLTPPSAGNGEDVVATVRFPMMAAPAGTRLRLRVVGTDTVYLDVELGAPTAGGMEVEVSGAAVSARSIAWPAAAVAEDEPEAGEVIPVDIVSAEAVATWLRAAVEVTMTRGDAQMEPPMIWWGTRGADGYARSGDRPELPLDAKAPPDKLALLDGIAWGAPVARTAQLRISRPATTGDTFDRWVNSALAGFGTGETAQIRRALRLAEAVAAKPSAREQIPDPAVEALVIEVIRLYPTRRTEVAPVVVAHWSGVPLPEEPGRAARTIDVVVVPAATYATAATWRDDKLRVSPGCIYELRCYGAAPLDQPEYAPAGMTVRNRFSRAAAASLREETIGADRWLLGTPLVMSVEVATDRMPAFELRRAPFSLELPAAAAPDTAMPLAGLGAPIRPAIVRIAPEFIDTGQDRTARYAALRSVAKIALIEQPWDWRGVPQPVLAATAGRFGEKHELDQAVEDYANSAHIWRDELDRLSETPAELTKAHVYGGRDVFDPSLPSDRVQLLRRDLPHAAGARLWRFGLRAVSRYAGLRPGDLRLQVASHKPPSGGVNWWPLLARDRLEITGRPRSPQRPGLMLVLPLTEPMTQEGTVPPLLALFNDQLFADGNIADGLEAVVEVARHPLTATEMMDLVHAPGFDAAVAQVENARRAVEEKRALLANALNLAEPALPADQAAAKAALQAAQVELGTRERAFAAIYAAGAAWGSLKRWQAIQSQTQTDQQAAQARYDAETDPAKKQAFKHDLDKLNERVAIVAQRVLDAESIASAPPATPYAGRIMDVASKFYQEWAPDPARTADPSGVDPVALRFDGPVGYTLDTPGQAGRYAHAGLLVSPVGDRLRPWSMIKLRFRRLEVPELMDVSAVALDDQWSVRNLDSAWAFGIAALTGDVEAAFSFETNADDSQVKLRASRTAGRLEVEVSTAIGALRTWSIAAKDNRTVEVRVVVSERPRPQGEEYAPSADVSVQIRITPPSVDSARLEHEGVWLSVGCLPLTSITKIEPDATPRLRAKMSRTDMVSARPVRASDFTPGIWCQFAAAMSLVELRGVVGSGANTQEVHAVVPVESLMVTPMADGAGLQLGVKDQALKKIGLSAVGAPDADSQLEERIYVVATRYVYDALDRLRERAVAIYDVGAEPDGPVLAKPTWTFEANPPFVSGAGRVRLLHVLRGRLKSEGGFEDVLRSFPGDFFGPGSEGNPEFPDDPPDAAGQVLGISRPIEWRRRP